MPTAANVRLSLLILNKLEFAVCRSPPPTMQNAESPLEETVAQIFRNLVGLRLLPSLFMIRVNLRNPRNLTILFETMNKLARMVYKRETDNDRCTKC